MAAERVAICAIAKNEGRYLGEWIAYHKLIGFDDILVYNPESDDDTEEVLARFADRGVTQVPWSVPPRTKPQWLAYEDGLERLHDADWIAFIDIDEFIVLPQHRGIKAFVRDYASRDAIAMNWKIFGSSERREAGEGLVIDRFRRCAPLAYPPHRQVKTLARPRAIHKPRVHTCQFNEGYEYVTVLGEVLGSGEGASRLISHEVIRINHYFTKSWEEWQQKSARGRGAKWEGHPKKQRTEAEFHAQDRNEFREREITRFIEPVTRYLAELGAPASAPQP
jgi:glycosyltransferase involved in cell wall biosynthesis